ncbi:MAG: HAD-IIIC family phosphatase [Proteobacteria bacterium]|nr:HAD-IIIC family phosphatase [Pseudomonadota bacterium]NBP13802.1 HAD-IIIC family phosphatase [bacterium]
MSKEKTVEQTNVREHIDIKCVIFDLDDTLIVHCPPFKSKVCKDVKYILESLKDLDIVIALASYNKNAENYLEHFGLRSYFSFVESEAWNDVSRLDDKLRMLTSIMDKVKVPSNQIVLFDDRKANIETARKLGMQTKYIPYSGITKEQVEEFIKL